MELSVQIWPGSEVTRQIGKNTFKSLIIAKTIPRAPFFDRCFF